VPFTRRSDLEAALVKLKALAKVVEKSSETNVYGVTRVGPQANPLLDAALLN
jgi:DNA-directed RNA polymerase